MGTLDGRRAADADLGADLAVVTQCCVVTETGTAPLEARQADVAFGVADAAWFITASEQQDQATHHGASRQMRAQVPHDGPQSRTGNARSAALPSLA